MRIEIIEVKNLFGIFHHKIPLNLKEHITIIHGPNGFGKTIMLNMLDAVFSSKYSTLWRIPFTELSLDFDDGSNLRIKRALDFVGDEKSRDDGRKLTFEFSQPGSKAKTYSPEALKRRIPPFPLSAVDDIIPTLDRIGPEEWLNLETREVLSFQEVLARFGDKFPRGMEERTEPEWLRQITRAINVYFIQAQRLLTFASPEREYRRRQPMVPAVMSDSKELAGAIQARLTEYASLSQSLDRTFPTRLVKRNGITKLTVAKLKRELEALEDKRSRLVKAGLLDREKEIDLADLLKNIGKSNRNVLSVFVQDVKEKLSTFDELTARIDLLVNTINHRFLYKQMSVSKKDGFIFTTKGGKELSPADLSSGEQHMLVLLYELLFRVKPNSLILIDEPELSLHVIWQQQFLKHLKEITGITGFDVLIATHSPQIIHDRWDLTVQLEGPADEGSPYSA
jgi:predicted ATP-binding protein involved in virulence